MTEKPKYKYEDIESEDIEKLLFDDINMTSRIVKNTKNDNTQDLLNKEDEAC